MNRSKRDLTIEEVKDYIDSPEPVILEIGCNDGTDTNKLLEEFPEGQIHCFEPDPRAIARFETTVNHDPWSWYALYEVAISDKDGKATFYGSSGRPPEHRRNLNHYCQLDEWDLSGSLCKPTGHLEYSPWTTFPKDRQYQVATMKLDTWLLELPEILLIDFIWCDVQGAEAKVIAGGTETLKHTKYFYTEFYDMPLYEGQLPLAELEKLLPNFELLSVHGDNALFKNREL